MNKRDAKRISLYLNGKWLLATDTSGLNDDQEAAISHADGIRLTNARDEIARELIQRSGLDEITFTQLLAAHLKDHPDAEENADG